MQGVKAMAASTPGSELAARGMLRMNALARKLSRALAYPEHRAAAPLRENPEK